MNIATIHHRNQRGGDRDSRFSAAFDKMAVGRINPFEEEQVESLTTNSSADGQKHCAGGLPDAPGNSFLIVPLLNKYQGLRQDPPGNVFLRVDSQMSRNEKPSDPSAKIFSRETPQTNSTGAAYSPKDSQKNHTEAAMDCSGKVFLGKNSLGKVCLQVNSKASYDGISFELPEEIVLHRMDTSSNSGSVNHNNRGDQNSQVDRNCDWLVNLSNESTEGTVLSGSSTSDSSSCSECSWTTIHQDSICCSLDEMRTQLRSMQVLEEYAAGEGRPIGFLV